MIKVIKHGKDIYEITCKRCGCCFSFDESDLETVGPRYDRSVRIWCPDCHSVLSGWDVHDLVNSYK